MGEARPCFPARPTERAPDCPQPGPWGAASQFPETPPQFNQVGYDARMKEKKAMANKSLFNKTPPGRLIPAADTKNNAGGSAYSMTDKAALAQLAVTGTLHDTFYVDGARQLGDILAYATKVDPLFVAQTAIYARQKGFMKDVPALLMAHLSTRNAGPIFPAAFRAVIDNGKMVKNFVQIMRSGTVGRKSLGTRPKKLVQAWLLGATEKALVRSIPGQDPSLADVVKMVRPKPYTAQQQAFFAYLIGKEHSPAMLPYALRQFETFKRDPKSPVPDVPFQMLTAQPLTKEHWAAIGWNAGWHMLRMNLNTFKRHGAFDVPGFTDHVAAKLRNPEDIKWAKVFPYQLLVAFHMTEGVPHQVRDALQDAMEVAVENVPAMGRKVVICPDVSGSMSSPVTGYRKGSTSAVTCNDVAALMTATLLRVNPDARVIPFEGQVVSTHRLSLNARDSIATNARKLASIGGGSTNCSAPMALLNAEHAHADIVIYISDNESWVDSAARGSSVYSWNRGTALMVEWEKFRQRNPHAKLVCIDLTPSTTSQASGAPEILNVGGFSDAVFDVVAAFADGRLGPDHWVGEIEKIDVLGSAIRE